MQPANNKLKQFFVTYQRPAMKKLAPHLVPATLAGLLSLSVAATQALAQTAAPAAAPAAAEATPEHTFVAGDNHNDLSMLALEVAHHLACPSNSLPIVKDAILSQQGFVASQPATQGCVEALSHYFYD